MTYISIYPLSRELLDLWFRQVIPLGEDESQLQELEKHSSSVTRGSDEDSHWTSFRVPLPNGNELYFKYHRPFNGDQPFGWLREAKPRERLVPGHLAEETDG